jgi:hypothetical protein
MNYEQLEVIVWNPTTMQITGSIDISSLKNPAYSEFEIRVSVIIGDKLYANYYNPSWDGGTEDSALTVAVFSTTEDVLLAALRDVIDVDTWTSRPMSDALRSEGWFGDTFIDGAPHFPDGSALVRYADGVCDAALHAPMGLAPAGAADPLKSAQSLHGPLFTRARRASAKPGCCAANVRCFRAGILSPSAPSSITPCRAQPLDATPATGAVVARFAMALR